MIPVTSFANQEIALFGLGGSGLATALALRAGGAQVTACDDNPGKMEEAFAKGIRTDDLRKADWSRFAALILSPGVPLTHPEPHWSAKLAKEAGVEIIGDIELFCRERAKIAPQSPFIAITGTNGKSTTTALVAHILRAAGHDVQLGGNIGTAILSLEGPSEKRIHVIECSSFQIDLAPSLSPSIGVLLNLSPDHIDRHGTMENYAAIKERLVVKADKAVIGADDGMSRAIIANLSAQGKNAIRVGLSDREAGSLFAQGGEVFANFEGQPRAIANLAGISSLHGDHNAQNAAAAIAVALIAQVDETIIQAALRSFPGLPHRMEEIERRGQTLLINDSKATNADSTEKALKSFDDIFWIVGGKPKEGGIAMLQPYFGKIRKAYLIGEAATEFAKTLGDAVEYVKSDTLANAVQDAARDSALMNAPNVVLLSPACASYDQFANYEMRGNHFRDLVRALPGINPTRGA